jgi:hypothetical protein
MAVVVCCNVNWLLTAVIYFLINPLVLQVEAQTCSEAEVNSCQAEVTNLYLGSPTNMSAVGSYCSQVSAACPGLDICTSQNLGTETVYQTRLESLGLRDGLNYFCTQTDIQRVFIQNRQCIVTNTDNTVTQCRQQETCDGYNDAFRCYYSTMKTLCNEDVSRIMTNFQLRRFQRVLTSIQCKIDTSNYLPSSGSTNQKSVGTTSRLVELAKLATLSAVAMAAVALMANGL